MMNLLITLIQSKHRKTREPVTRRMASRWILVSVTAVVVALMTLPATSEARQDIYHTDMDVRHSQKEYCSIDDLSCDNEMTNFLLVGKTGAGKSATANSIVLLEPKPFKSKATAAPVTTKFQIEYSKVLGKKVKVIDGPGLGDPNMNETENINLVISEMTKAVGLTPDGYDAIILVVRYGRFTEDDKTTIVQLKAIFGENFMAEYGILLLTHGDNYDQDENDGQTFEEWCLQQTGIFKNLYEECGGRALLFDNKSKDKRVQEKQLKQLFKMVDDMKHGSRRYKPDLFKLAQAERDRLLLKSKEPAIRQETEIKIRFLMHELNAVNLEDPETDLLKLKDIRERVNTLLDDVKKQDNGTGALTNITEWIESVSHVVDKKEVVTEVTIKHNKDKKEMRAEIAELKKLEKTAEERYTNLERPQSNLLTEFLNGLVYVYDTGRRLVKWILPFF